jgi:phasin family protein
MMRRSIYFVWCIASNRENNQENTMYPDQNQVLAFQKTNVDALQAFGSAMFAATEKLSQLTIDATRGFMQDSAGVAHALLSARDPQELAKLATAASQPAAEKFAAYAKSAYTIANATSAELGRVFEAQITEGNRKLSDMIDAAAKTAPAGSEQAISMLKSSLSAANTAFDAVTKATRQASATAETNIAAAVAAATDAAKLKKAA